MQESRFDIRWSEVDLGCVLRLIRSKLWMIFLAFLSGVMGASLILSVLSSGSYCCTTDFAVSSRSTTGSSLYSNTTAAAEVVAIYSELFEGRFMQNSVNAAGYGPLNGSISASQIKSTCLIKVTVTSPSPRDALLIMQVILDHYNDLSDYISSTAVLVPLNTPNITVSPTNHYNVRQIRLLAGGLSAAAIIAALTWISVSAGTIQNAEGARNRVDSRRVATIPHEKSAPSRRGRRRRKEARLSILNPRISFRFVESILRLAYRLEYEHAKGLKVFLFTSVSEAEGKSTLAANTALSLAARKNQVLFIDLDLRRPVQADILTIRVDGEHELGNQLSAGRSAAEILDSAIYDPTTGLTLLLSRKSYADKIHLITSPVLAELLVLAREHFDYILLDTPPLGYFSDSELISDFADGSVLVIRQDVVPAPQINDAIDALSAGKAVLLGYVLNDMRDFLGSVSSSGYGQYGRYEKYGRYSKREASGQRHPTDHKPYRSSSHKE